MPHFPSLKVVKMVDSVNKTPGGVIVPLESRKPHMDSEQSMGDDSQFSHFFIGSLIALSRKHVSAIP